MLVAAALVPDTALLVPGAAGTASVLDGLRSAALHAVAHVVALVGTGTVVVVAPGPAHRELAGTVLPSLGAAGVPDHLLGWPVRPVALPGRGSTDPSVPSSVALHLLTRAGRTDGLRVVEVTSTQAPRELSGLG